MDASLTSSALRDLGARAFRAGKMAHQSIGYAEKYVGRLNADQRRLVMAGWAQERLDTHGDLVGCEVVS